MTDLRVACVMVLKNEDDLIEPWLYFHGHLFGLKNLFVFDNGSTSEKTIEVLHRYAGMGVNVDFSKNTLEHHRSRSIWLGELIRKLGDDGYDFIFPLDCDEFLALREHDQVIRSDKQSILGELQRLANKHAIFQAYQSYPNLIGSPGIYQSWSQKKHFFSNRSFGSTDHGFHAVTGIDGAVFEPTNFAYIHYHYKPFEIMVAHSKQKLARDYNVNDLTSIPQDNRLGQFLYMEPASYKDFLSKFERHKKYTAPALRDILKMGGLELPFSTYKDYHDMNDTLASSSNSTPDFQIQEDRSTRYNRYPEIFDAVRTFRAGSKEDLSILSFGCSTGEEPYCLARDYFLHAKFFGLDTSPEAIASAKTERSLGGQITYDLSTTENLLRHGPYDVIFAMSVLCRWPLLSSKSDSSEIFPFSKYLEIVTLLDRCLKPGGLLVIYNSNYSFAETPLISGYEIVLVPTIQNNGFVRHFDRSNKVIYDYRGSDVIYSKLPDAICAKSARTLHFASEAGARLGTIVLTES